MRQGSTAFPGGKCARCRQAIKSDPAFDDHLWYHRPCLEEGIRALQRAHALAARFGFGSADAHPAEAQRGHAASARLRVRPDGHARQRDSAC